MQAGNYSLLAKDYSQNRPDYSRLVLSALLGYVGAKRRDFVIADVGAGTGIWTKMLADEGFNCIAVEPNDAMREQGIIYTRAATIDWRAGSAEDTSLEMNTVDWVTMASSFHWVKQPDGLQEFGRILKIGGYLTVLWNPRDIEGDPFHEGIENLIHEFVPDLRRVSSGAAKHAKDYSEVLVSTGHFEEVLFIEAKHRIVMSKERYLGAWRSVNDIQVQAGPERFSRILRLIEERIYALGEVVVPYKTRAWTARKCCS